MSLKYEPALNQVGDKINAGDVMMVVESDKADMDVEVPSLPLLYYSRPRDE